MLVNLSKIVVLYLVFKTKSNKKQTQNLYYQVPEKRYVIEPLGETGTVPFLNT